MNRKAPLRTFLLLVCTALLTFLVVKQLEQTDQIQKILSLLNKVPRPPITTAKDEPTPPKPPDANQAAAKRGLFIIQHFQEGFSIEHGGRGASNFAASFQLLTNDMDPSYRDALRFPGASPKPAEGYLFEMQTGQSPDTKWATNYVVTARPAPGFAGPILQVTPSGSIITNIEIQTTNSQTTQ